MKSKKLILASSICAAFAGASGIVNAGIPAVPGEALLVPLVLTAGGPTDGAGTETYVGLRVPLTIGTDTIINEYTAPHTTTFGASTTQTVAAYPPAKVPRIYWAMFNEKSVKVDDGTCDVSPGDMTLWTTDAAVKEVQLRQRAMILDAGVQDVPDPVCGPNATTRPRFAYVVFQTVPGADGMDADFAFTGEAMARSSVYGATISVPVLPMADGKDPMPVGSGTPEFLNEVIAGGTYGDGIAFQPLKYAPIIAGIRMNDADGNVAEQVVTQMPISGPAGGSGLSLHVHWFDRNDAARLGYNDIYDDMEGQCSETWPLPNELNLTMYNQSIQGVPAGGFPKPGWGNVAMGFNTDGSKINVIQSVEPAFGEGIGAAPYCIPDYWQEMPGSGRRDYPGALVGYVETRMSEINSPLPTGRVNSAAVQFSAVEDLGGRMLYTVKSVNPEPMYYSAGWSSHLATDLGKQ